MFGVQKSRVFKNGNIGLNGNWYYYLLAAFIFRKIKTSDE